jgi:hypothetical protein
MAERCAAGTTVMGDRCFGALLACGARLAAG